MGAALSLDLRRRVIAAIEAGTSCRRAAARFGVGIATTIRWQAQLRREGDIAAKPMGGDRTSHRIEAHAALILTTSRGIEAAKSRGRRRAASSITIASTVSTPAWRTRREC